MDEEDIKDFFRQQKKRMDLPEEDMSAYMARRAQTRKASSKRRMDNLQREEEIPIVHKRSKVQENTTISSKRSPVVNFAGRQTTDKPSPSAKAPAMSLFDAQAEEQMDMDALDLGGPEIGAKATPARTRSRAPSFDAPSISSPFDIDQVSKPEVQVIDMTTGARTCGKIQPKNIKPLIGSTAERLPSKSVHLVPPKLHRAESVSVVSHQRASKRATHHSNQVTTLSPEKESDSVVADTSNITTPGSTPISAVKKRSVPNAAGSSSTKRAETVLAALTSGHKELQQAPNKSNIRFTKLKPGRQKIVSLSKKTKEKPQLMTPTEYAEMLVAKYSDPSRKIPKNVSQFLKGKNIFYTEGDLKFAGESTRKKMELIVKHGGTLVSRYNPDVVTHIVTRANEQATTKELGLKSIMDIPLHIPTVKWSWIESANASARRKSNAAIATSEKEVSFNMPPAYLHSAFRKRFDAGDFPGGWAVNKNHGNDKGKGKERERASSTDPDYSRISEFTENPNDSDYNSEDSDIVPNFQSGITPRHGKSQEDPLAEFYAQAKADVEWGMDESDEELRPEIPSRSDVGRWTCDRKGGILKGPCPNQDIVDKLTELQGLHKVKPGDENQWRVFSYSKSIRAIMNHPTRINSEAEACAINGVGDKTAKKIMEIIRTGGLRRIGYETTEDAKVNKLFQGVFGVGMKTACAWYANGARTLADVVAGKGGIKLTTQQDIGIRFYDDINERMPRSEVEEIFKKIERIALGIDPKLFIKVMGSYRRGAETCGDIDVLITRPIEDGKTHAGVVRKIWLECHAHGVITEDLVMPDDFNDLELIYRGLCRRDGSSKRRRLDFLSVPWSEKGAALLYYTGDSIFNRSMRLKARKNGMSLNQRGLFQGVVRSPQNQAVKTSDGSLLASETEEEIFRILHVPWQEAHERVRGHDV